MLRGRKNPILQHPRVEPFADQSQDHTIAHPSLEELPQVTMVDRVEKFETIARLPGGLSEQIAIKGRSSW